MTNPCPHMTYQIQDVCRRCRQLVGIHVYQMPDGKWACARVIEEGFSSRQDAENCALNITIKGGDA